MSDLSIRIPGDERAGAEVILPASALRLLKDVLAEMAQGRAVAILPVQAELTTQQAADLLNVSRPYLIGLLEERKIPFRLVGQHRRVRLDDLLSYKRKDDERRRQIADELAADGQELGMGYWATLIVTFNLLDFPLESLAPHGVEARHPDALFSELLDATPEEFCAAARLQRLALKNPPMTVEEFLAEFEEVGLPRTALRLRNCADRLWFGLNRSHK
jgi:excisionase family DNA binding protein